ncbi:hypothetical protein [Rhizobium sp. TAL182]|uniref:hypothetical protein n=1 Tax=Rhizobium sp. TAL182 TaxID=2020313 RepID=UPI000F74ACB3|nr:hypothetical protein [Rhizobium sp. TAL182]
MPEHRLIWPISKNSSPYAHKRSAAGQEAANIVRDAVDDPKQHKNLMKLAPFILKHEITLRAIAGDQREFKFLHQWLDWFKANLD